MKSVTVSEPTYREGLSSLLDHKALDEVGEDLRFDHCLGNRHSVFVPKADSWQGQRQRQGRRRRKGSCYRRSY